MRISDWSSDVCSSDLADPKGVLHSANSLLAEVWQSYPDNDPASRVMSPYPAGHVAGALGVLAPAAAARRTLLFETYDADAAARSVGSERIKIGRAACGERGGTDV